MKKTEEMSAQELFADIVDHVGEKYVVYQAQLDTLVAEVRRHEVFALRVTFLTNSNKAEVELFADTEAVLASRDLA